HPNEAIEAGLPGLLNGEFVLENYDRFFAGAIGDRAVTAAHEVDREAGTRQEAGYGFDVFGFDVGEGLVREDGVAMETEVGFQGFAGLSAVIAGFGKVDDWLGRVRSAGGRRDGRLTARCGCSYRYRSGGFDFL